MSFGSELRKVKPEILEVIHWTDDQADFWGPRKTLAEYWHRLHGYQLGDRLLDDLRAIEKAARKARKK